MAVGTEGYYWSSSSYVAGDHGAAILGITASGVTPLGMGRRGVGRSVRCVQHLPTAFCPYFAGSRGQGTGLFRQAGLRHGEKTRMKIASGERIIKK
ncbi:hypothetical protein [Alistipes sp.]|uniref:hypothetical protein n=1 Tax=Alistipes sp. TaxID=1872444 RepID=UPI0025960D4A|nr:hypothetical protein [uncultured Alistipes sp.]